MNQTLQNLQNEITNLERQIEGHQAMLEHDQNAEMKELFEQEISALQSQKAELEKTLNSMQNGYESGYENASPEESFDEDPNIVANTAILEVRAGTGGNEAGIFANDLFNMYNRFAEKQGWKKELIAFSQGEHGGVKTGAVKFIGPNVYKLLRNESGAHRVQRVPVTESGGRIHTSTATVAVLPELKKVHIEIRPEDLKLDFYRAGGHGGQNVNKVSTAVRITHMPTGVVVECQEERSQLKNREKAMKILESRLYTMMQAQKVQEISQLRAEQVGTGERSEKIRTYNYPQDRITDHRLNVNWHNIPARMNGEIADILQESSTTTHA